jgi:hypothetical protein
MNHFIGKVRLINPSFPVSFGRSFLDLHKQRTMTTNSSTWETHCMYETNQPNQTGILFDLILRGEHVKE